jgi:hypothetical protein
MAAAGKHSLLVLALLWMSVGAADVWYGQLRVTRLTGSVIDDCGGLIKNSCDLYIKCDIDGVEVIDTKRELGDDSKYYTWSTGAAAGVFDADKAVQIYVKVRVVISTPPGSPHSIEIRFYSHSSLHTS